jgi:thiosulfate dehydrogenase [quinone] large subunit
MSVIHESTHQVETVTTTDPHRTLSGYAQQALAVLRIAFGFTFLWAFLDKAFALGFSTGRDDAGVVDRFGPAAWIHGGSPTMGFLKFGADGPFKGIWNSLAGTTFADWGFMLGLLAIGTALILGIGMRLAAVAGSALLVLMWSASLPLTTNPFLDDHLVYAIVLVLLALIGAGNTLGLGARWAELPFVAKNGWLK